MKKIIIPGSIIAVVILISAYVFLMGPKDQSDVAPNFGSGNTVTFDMVAKQFEFVPSVLNVSKGDNVVINITSADVAHGFAIRELGINESIQPGETKQIRFVADEVGSFTFRCSVSCGSGHMDMAGKLIVSEKE